MTLLIQNIAQVHIFQRDLQARMHAEFVEDRSDVIFHRAMTNREVRSDFAIRFSRDDQLNDVVFARREHSESACERCGSHMPTVLAQH